MDGSTEMAILKPGHLFLEPALALLVVSLAGLGEVAAEPEKTRARQPALAQQPATPSPNYIPVPPGFPAYPEVPPPLRPIPGPGLAVADQSGMSDPEPLEDPIARLRELENRLDQTRELMAKQRPMVSVGGYVDFGFFVPQGNGSGITRDNGNELFPQYEGQYGWVFLGDLLAPTVNTRGEVADLGQAAGAARFDSIHSGGAPGFIANEINLTLSSGITENVLGTVSVNFVPRTGGDFAIGDFIDLDVAQVEWVLTDSGKTSLFIGKFDSLLGVEYRDRKANTRFGITPSLMARYTTGTALGLKLRTKFGPDDLFVVAGAVTNGSNTQEQFHFFDEIDTNAGKTGSGRIAIRPPVGFGLELGASGSYGAQDRAMDSTGAMHFVGLDLLAQVGALELKAQWLKGKSPGRPVDNVYGLELHGGAYLESNMMVTPWLGLLARGEYRDAFVWLGNPSAPDGANRAYLTKSWRATGGLRLVFNERITLKAEYLRNGEYGGIPENQERHVHVVVGLFQLRGEVIIMRSKKVVAGLALAALVGAGARPAAAQKVESVRPGPTWAEFRQLEAEVREQRQMVIQLMQTEQQRYDMLLRLLQSGAAASPAASAAAPAPAASGGESERARSPVPASTRPPERSEPRFGVVEGKIKIPGGDTSDLYVYIDNYRGPLVRGKAVEIKQENKQFIPRVQVVPIGTSVTFPNLDPIFHNVFSNSPRNSFDLGSYRAGDQSRAAVFNSPGVVDIFCNIHQRMSAHVLVVPSKLYTRVRPDGGFRIEGVPAGLRNVVAWSPSLKPILQKVEVGTGIASRVAFDMEYTDQKAHTNKMGMPYGSYKE